MRKFNNCYLKSLITISTLALLPACGGAQRDLAAESTSDVGQDQGSSTSSDTGSDGSGDNFLPTLTYSFNLTGEGGTAPSYTTPEIDTDNLIKVRITPGSAGQISIDGYSNFTANYNCISYTLTAIGKSVVTQTLSINGGGYLCPDSQENEIIDFSDRLGPGHDPVTIKVSAVRYDFYCQQFWTNYYLGIYSPYGTSSAPHCPLKTLYKTHTISGSLEIEVNGSSAL